MHHDGIYRQVQDCQRQPRDIRQPRDRGIGSGIQHTGQSEHERHRQQRLHHHQRADNDSQAHDGIGGTSHDHTGRHEELHHRPDRRLLHTQGAALQGGHVDYTGHRQMGAACRDIMDYALHDGSDSDGQRLDGQLLLHIPRHGR